MSKYEFRGATLDDSLRRAISPHRYNRTVKADTATCIRIEAEIREAANILQNKESNIERLSRSIESLRSRRNKMAARSLIGFTIALSTLSGALSAARAIRRAMSAGRNISARDILSLVPVIGGLAQAAIALKDAYDFDSEVGVIIAEIGKLRREIEVLDSDLDRLRVLWSAGCENPNLFVG